MTRTQGSARVDDIRIGKSDASYTGGSSGIGLALAKRFVEAGNGSSSPDVARTPRRSEEGHPIVDHGSERQRERARSCAPRGESHPTFPAPQRGHQQRRHPAEGQPPRGRAVGEHARGDRDQSRRTDSPGFLLLPHLLRQEAAVLANVQLGPRVRPDGSRAGLLATKAALHSYTLSLRHQLRSTSIDVIEIIPPAVHSNLGGSHRVRRSDRRIRRLRDGAARRRSAGSDLPILDASEPGLARRNGRSAERLDRTVEQESASSGRNSARRRLPPAEDSAKPEAVNLGSMLLGRMPTPDPRPTSQQPDASLSASRRASVWVVDDNPLEAEVIPGRRWLRISR